MENFNNLKPNNVTLEVTENSKLYLKSAAAWSKFMAIVGFIGAGFLVLCGLLFIPLGALLNSLAPSPVPFSFLGFIYFIIAVLIFFPAFYLIRFSNKTVDAIVKEDTQEMEAAHKNLKAYWKFRGILTIIMLSLYVLAIPIIVVAAIAARGIY